MSSIGYVARERQRLLIPGKMITLNPQSSVYGYFLGVSFIYRGTSGSIISNKHRKKKPFEEERDPERHGSGGMEERVVAPSKHTLN